MIRFLLVPLFVLLVGFGVYTLINQDPDGFVAFDEGNYGIAREQLTPIAEEGFDRAQYVLGRIYEEGLGVPKDPEAARQWYQLAADQGHEEALAKIGTGNGATPQITQNSASASGADTEHDESQPEAPKIEAQKSEETETDTTVAQKAAVTPGSLEDGIQAYQNGEYVKAREILSPFSEQGLAKAQFYLGQIYRKALDVTGDEKKGINLIMQAAHQGHDEAQYLIGFSYENDFGVEYEQNKSLYWFQKAAAQNHPKARTRLPYALLGGAYFAGYGSFVRDVKGHQVFEVEKFLRIEQLEKNYTDIEQLAKQGDSGALVELGEAYISGDGKTQNIELGMEYLERGARDDPDQALAMYRLGGLYSSGKEIPQDFERATYWYEKAFDHGIDYAGNDLGELFLKRTDYPNSRSEALNWFEKSAKAGYAVAQYKLAEHYFNDDKNNDLETAFYWAHLAAEQAHKEAQFFLASLYEKGEGTSKNLSQAVRWYRHAKENRHSFAQAALLRVDDNFPSLIMDPLAPQSLEQDDFYREYYRGVGAYEKNQRITAKDIWFRLASKGYAPAQLQLKNKFNWAYSEHYEQVDLWFQEAAESGYPRAQEQYASELAVSSFDKAELQRVYIWYKRAADQGRNKSIAEVISAQFYGTGVPKSNAKAQELTIHYAEQGSEYAQFQLGYWYEHGLLVDKNLEQARDWYQKSADQGYWLAIDALEALGSDNAKSPTEKPGDVILDTNTRQEKSTEQEKLARKGINLEEATEDKSKLSPGAQAHFSIELEKAFALLSAEAEGGDPISQHLLAIYYFAGLVVPIDFDEAHKWFSLAAEAGVDRSQKTLGDMYSDPDFERLDYDLAIEWYKRAAIQGLDQSQYSLGLLYASKDKGPYDLDEAVRWLELAAAQEHQSALAKLAELIQEQASQSQASPSQAVAKADDPRPQQNQEQQGKFSKGERSKIFGAALFFYGIEDYENALKSGLVLAEQGDLEAQILVSEAYKKMNPPDHKKAFSWAVRAAESGDGQALTLLATHYISGKGVERDFNKAYQLHTEAAKQNIGNAHMGLGLHYRYGIGAPQDLNKAASHYATAAQLGEVGAYYSLGMMHDSGDFGERDIATAQYFYELGAKAGDPKAKQQLSLLQKQLDSLPKPKRKPSVIPPRPKTKQLASQPEKSIAELSKGGKYDKMLQILEPKAKKGDPEAIHLLAGMYFRGKGVEEDMRRAFRLYGRAARKGFHESQAIYAYFYMAGEVVDRNLNEAHDWALKSAVQGNALGQVLVGKILSEQNDDEASRREIAKWYKLAAEQGDVEGQALLGVTLSTLSDRRDEGMMWLYVAAAQGSRVAKKVRDDFLPLTPEAMITNAKEKARNCMAQNYKGC